MQHMLDIIAIGPTLLVVQTVDVMEPTAPMGNGRWAQGSALCPWHMEWLKLPFLADHLFGRWNERARSYRVLQATSPLHSIACISSVLAWEIR